MSLMFSEDSFLSEADSILDLPPGLACEGLESVEQVDSINFC